MHDIEDELDWDVDPEYLKQLQEKYKGEDFPLFMDELPNDTSGNPHLEALQTIANEDTDMETRAKELKAHGNDCIATSFGSRHKDAVQSYSLALNIPFVNDTLRSVIHSNRAQALLASGALVKCVDDCRAALKLDNGNVKACFRGCKASSMMGLYRQATNFARRGLRAEPSNGPLEALQAECETKLRNQEKRRDLYRVQAAQ
eukprot:GHVU01039141.1.p2 GENE.GHVU01039141.1~~GHVU01039141.1.p2  ORF type:complete len:202 (+),score=47.09 GHVU01039141.1:322-927(+)